MKYDHNIIPEAEEPKADETKAPNFLERTAAKFAGLLRFFQQVSIPNVKRRKGVSAKTAGRTNKLKRRGRAAVQWAPQVENASRRMARGPGSISVESDIMQLAREGKADEAGAMFEAHHRLVGVRPITNKAVLRNYEMWKQLKAVTP